MTPYLSILLKLSACFLALFLLAELLYRFAHIKATHTRKLVHIGTGVLTMLFPIYFSSTWQVVIMCTSFLLLLLLSLRYRFLPSINNIDRRSAGSLLYPVIVVLVFAYYHYMSTQSLPFNALLYFYLPILALAIGDPIAAVAGSTVKSSNPTGKKTNRGTLYFFYIVTLLSFILIYAFRLGHTSFIALLLYSLVMGALTAFTERFTGGGWDNFTIPLMACAWLFILSKFLA